MRRRAIGFITVLALCLSLYPARALSANDVDPGPTTRYPIGEDVTNETTYIAAGFLKFDTCGNHYTITKQTAIRVGSTARLYLTTGTIESKNGAGIEILSGGYLRVDNPGMTVIGTTYGLDFSDGATARLSGGTFIGNTSAIRAADGDYGALLVSGHAYFDGSGRPVALTDVYGKTAVTVKECTDHLYRYTPDDNAPTHSWVCEACGERSAASEKCSFSFDADGLGQCAECGHIIEITVAIDEDRLIYDGTAIPGPDDISTQVTLAGSVTGLTRDADYTVACLPGVNAGEIVTVTVDGSAYVGTFEKTFRVSRAKPVIKWDTDAKPDPVEVFYDGRPVEGADLPPVIIEAPNADALKGSIDYSYRKAGDAGFTDGLPTDAGTYEVKASLPEQDNYEAASSDTITLTIKPIDPMIASPEAIEGLVYNGAAQVLVTAGSVWDGAVIQFASSADGPWSTDIPTGTNAGSYTVWYKTEGNGNYDCTGAAGSLSIAIRRKPITPIVELERYTYVYDGGFKTPSVTVRDEDNYWNPLPGTEYEVKYANNQNVSTADQKASVTITDKTGGNYEITPQSGVVVEFEITPADQDTLTITNRPNAVLYGDVFTLETTGGSGSGAVTWEIIGAKDSGGNPAADSKTIAQIDQNSGRVTVKGVGTVTVRATKSGADSGGSNHVTATAEWEFTAERRPVTAAVTADNKTYDGDTAAVIHAVVEQGVISGDTIAITGLTGAFIDPNAGTNKIVTVTGEAVIGGTGSANYIVTVPGTPFDIRADITPKPVEAAVALTPEEGEAPPVSFVYTGKAIEPAVTVTYEENGEGGAVNTITIPPAEYTVAYRNNTDVGTAAVTVTARAGGNYTFTNSGPVETTFKIEKGESASLTSAPQGRNLTYTGELQNLVLEGTAAGGHLEYSLDPGSEKEYSATIPQGKDAGTYTVYYKVVGDGNYADDPKVYSVDVTIRPKTVTDPVLGLGSFDPVYDGSEKKPDVTSVIDDGTEILSELSAKTVTYSNNTDAGTATVHISATGQNYVVRGSTTFEITKAAPTATAPTARTGLKYNGTAQELIARGSSPHGKMVYARDNINGNYSEDVPAAAAVGEYTIYYKVLGDSNHKDSEGAELPDKVKIEKNTVTAPTITLSSDTFRYNGSQQKPTVTVRDDDGLLIADTEYVVQITGAKAGNNSSIDVDAYTITVTGSENSNYVFKADEHGVFHNTATYQIVEADQETISITGTRDQVCYGDTIQLGVTGGTGEGTVEWSVTTRVTDSTSALKNEITQGGLLTVREAGASFTVTAVRTSSANYNTASTTWVFYASPKPVTAVLTGVDKPYDETTAATVKAKVNPGDLVSGDKIVIQDLTGTFENANAGTNKKITITTAALTFDEANSKNRDKYAITCPDTATADITPRQLDRSAVTLDPTFFDADGTVEYDGTAKTPGVTVRYNNKDISTANYTVAYRDNINAGTATVTVKNVDGGNYMIDWSGAFEIRKADPTVNPPTAKTGLTYTGASQELIFRGSSPDGKMVYSLDGTNYFEDVPTAVTADNYTVSYKVLGDSNHKSSTPASVAVTIGKAVQNPLSIIDKPSGAIRYGDHFTLSTSGGSGGGAVTWSGAIVDADGLVTVTGTGDFTITATKAGGQNYEDATAKWTFTASQAQAAWSADPGSSPTTLKYTGSPLELVTAGSTVNSIGVVTYRVERLDQEPEGPDALDGDVLDEGYSTLVPTAADKGTYRVWYRVTSSVNWKGIDPKYVDVTIAETAGTESSNGAGSTHGSGSSSTSGSSASTNNTPAAGGSNASMQTSVRDGTANTVLDTAAGNRLVNEAVASRSENVVIKPEITGDVTKTVVSIPASAVSRISRETDAALTVSTPVADVTIPNGALDALSSAGGAVSVVTEQVENTVVLTLTAGSRDIGSIPEGLTLTVPVEDAGPGTVAILIREDGTRETIRRSVAGDGELRIPLDGSATVEIVDNSKEFADVSAESWAADAVAFASAREMFNGTSETTFSPEQAMSRAMLATVLYNLEGRPDQSLSGGFSDVNSDAWYAAGVSWAAENGITGGYGDGQFGPDDGVTREQFAVMLWRYAGSPTAGDQALDFSDAGQASDYAMEALRWAAANGILNGYGNGRLDPGGPATRAQAAQMLKNFIENT